MADHSPHGATAPAGVDDVPRRTAAEEARTLVAGAVIATLSTLTADGHPWGSLVSFATLADGSPVLCLSTLAEHGRNLQGDPRASLLVAEAIGPAEDPLEAGRVTLSGSAHEPDGAETAAAREALLAVHPTAAVYVDWDDFALWVLRVDRVRWVGGFARMVWVDGRAYAVARPDPVAPYAAGAVRHLNEDHADALLEMAQALGGRPDATAAACTSADRYGLDLRVRTPDGPADLRVAFTPSVDAPDGLRAATVALTRQARDALRPSG
jgi:putative heme iron utilization protein